VLQPLARERLCFVTAVLASDDLDVRSQFPNIRVGDLPEPVGRDRPRADPPEQDFEVALVQPLQLAGPNVFAVSLWYARSQKISKLTPAGFGAVS